MEGSLGGGNGDSGRWTWGPEYREDLEYLRVWVSRLRRKFEEDPAHPRCLKTIPGIGYLFSDE